MEALRAVIALFLIAAFIADQSSSLSLHSIHKRDTSDNEGSSNGGDDAGESGSEREAADSSQGSAGPAATDEGSDSNVAALGDQYDSQSSSNNLDIINPDGVEMNAMTGPTGVVPGDVDMGLMTDHSDSDSGDGYRDDSSEGKKCSKCKNKLVTGDATGTDSDDSRDDSNTGSDDSLVGVGPSMGLDAGYGLSTAADSDDSNSGSGGDDSNAGDVGIGYAGLNVRTGNDDSNSGSGSDDSLVGVGGVMGIRNDDSNSGSDDSGEGTDGDDSRSGKKCSRCRDRESVGPLGVAVGYDDLGDGTGSDDSGDDSGEGRECNGIGCPNKGDDSQEGAGSDSGSDRDGYVHGITTGTDSQSSDSNENLGGDSSSGEDLGELPPIYNNIGEDRLATGVIMSEGPGTEINRIGLDNPSSPVDSKTDWPGVSTTDLFMESANNVPLPSSSTWRDPPVSPTPIPGLPGYRDPRIPGDRGEYLPTVPSTEQPTFVKPQGVPGMESISLNVAPSIEPTVANYIQPPDMRGSIPPTPTPSYEANQYIQNVPLEPDMLPPTPSYEPNQFTRSDIIGPNPGYESNQYTPDTPFQPNIVPPTEGYVDNQYVDNIPTPTMASSNIGGGMETVVDQISPNLGPVNSESYSNPASTSGFVDLSIRGKGHLVDGGPTGVDGVAVGNYIRGPNEVKTWSDSTQASSTGVIELFHNSGKTHGLRKICVHIRQGPVDAQTAAIQARQPGGLKTLLKTILHDGVVTSERVVNQHGDAAGKIDIKIPDGSVDIASQIGSEIGPGIIDNQMDPGYSDVNLDRVPQAFLNEPREIRFTQDAMRRRPSRIFLAISSKMKEADRSRPFDYIPSEATNQAAAAEAAQGGQGVIRVFTSQPDGSRTMKRVFVNIRQPSPVTIRRSVKIPLTRTFSTGNDGSVSIGFGGRNPAVGPIESGPRLSGSVTGEMMRADGGHLHSDIVGHTHDGHAHDHFGHGHDGHVHPGDNSFRMGGQQMNEVALPNGRFHVHTIGDRNVVHDHHHGDVDRETYRRVMELLNRPVTPTDSSFDPFVNTISNARRRRVEEIGELPNDMEDPGRIVIFFTRGPGKGRLRFGNLRTGEMLDDSKEDISKDDSKEKIGDTSDSQEDDNGVEQYDRSPLNDLQTDSGNSLNSKDDSSSADVITGQDVSKSANDDSNELPSLVTGRDAGTSDEGRDDSKEEIGALQDGIGLVENVMEKGGDDDSNDDDGDDRVKTSSKESITGAEIPTSLHNVGHSDINVNDVRDSDTETVQNVGVLETEDGNQDNQRTDNDGGRMESTDDSPVAATGEKGQDD